MKEDSEIYRTRNGNPRKKKTRKIRGLHTGPRIPKDITIKQLIGTLI